MTAASRVFDIAIIGGGSAGCALAARLAVRSELHIAVIEAGPDYGPRARGGWPAELVDGHRSPVSHDWGFVQSRARVLGGCSVHNESAFVRARPGDFDRWSLPGWSDAELAPLIAAIARAVPTTSCPDAELATWQRAFLEAAFAVGYPRHDSDDPRRGVGPFVQNLRDGVRWNAAFTFLDPVRERLTIIGDFVADRLEFEAGRARALLGRGPDGPCEVHARRFVLCAGVYGSPAILLRSGVGPAAQLARLGIPVIEDLPGVGDHLHDHPGVSIAYEPTRRVLRASHADERQGRQYESQIVASDAPDLHVLPYQVSDGGVWSFGIVAYYLDPRSRGHMRLVSRDPQVSPRIELGLLSDARDHDADALVEGLRQIHRLTGSAPLARAIARGPRRFAAHDRLAQFVRDNVTDYGHSVGTCRMGASSRAGDVVDARGRVHGLANVFVADASIMPRAPRANTNFTCYVIGSRMADLLLPSMIPVITERRSRSRRSRPPSHWPLTTSRTSR